MNKLQWKLHYREQRISSKEEWKPVPGYEGRYIVSSMGRMKGFGIKSRGKKGFIEGYYDKDGYKCIDLWTNKVRKRYKIHRLILEVFIGIDENKRYVNHINGIKYDNRLSNLEWVTAKENSMHAFTLRNIWYKMGTITIDNKIVSVQYIANLEGISYRSMYSRIRYHGTSDISKLVRIHQKLISLNLL